MGRRSIISMTTINRLISASNRRKREQARSNLINSQTDSRKEMPPEYSLSKVDFNCDNRMAKIEILQSQQYRTIDRYVTQNYVRYPIYSYWKTRPKVIKKSIKLTNKELENLNANADYIIQDLSKDIILALNNEELLPSWFLRDVYLEEHRQKVEELNETYNDFKNDCETNIKIHRKLINVYQTDLPPVRTALSNKTAKSNKLKSKLTKVEKANKNFAKYIFTFGIYAFFVSDNRKRKLSQKIEKCENEITVLKDSIKQKEQKIVEYRKLIDDLYIEIENKSSTLKSDISHAYNGLKHKTDKITPLPEEVKTDSGYIPLKSLNGMEYKKIIGCYAIRNIENNKYYVGQSKDVIKRIKQHFKGTVPSNVIFAEDYYLSLPENRDKLFEIKIIPCETKDELDRTEKQLIEEYDSFNKGYNGTSGNT